MRWGCGGFVWEGLEGGDWGVNNGRGRRWKEEGIGWIERDYVEEKPSGGHTQV